MNINVLKSKRFIDMTIKTYANKIFSVFAVFFSAIAFELYLVCDVMCDEVYSIY